MNKKYPYLTAKLPAGTMLKIPGPVPPDDRKTNRMDRGRDYDDQFDLLPKPFWDVEFLKELLKELSGLASGTVRSIAQQYAVPRHLIDHDESNVSSGPMITRETMRRYAARLGRDFEERVINGEKKYRYETQNDP